MKRNFNNKQLNLLDTRFLLQNEHYYRNQLLNALNDESAGELIDELFELLLADKDQSIEQIAIIYPKLYIIKHQRKVIELIAPIIDKTKEETEKILLAYHEYYELYTSNININQLNDDKSMASFILQQDKRISFKEFYQTNRLTHQIIDAMHHHYTPFLTNQVATIIEKEQKVTQQKKIKLMNSIITKARRHLRSKKNLSTERLLELKTNTLTKISDIIQDGTLLQSDIVLSFIKDIDQFLNQQTITLMLPAIIYFKYKPTITKKTYKQEDLDIVLSFYNKHHIYIKLKKIKAELTTYPNIIDFFKQYFNITFIAEKSEQIIQFDMLIEDINVQGKLKKLELLGKLLSICKKEVERIIDEDTNISKQTTKLSSQPKKVYKNKITIGGFTLDPDSVKANPDTLENLLPLITLEDEKQKDYLECLIYEVGFDKLKAYILKQPNLTVNSLLWIVRTDRLLRSQYQSLLEGVEIYFRSSFTQYLSNKYDEIYEVIGMEEGKQFYYRGYLRNYIFDDNDLHFDNIKRLNTRIDNEIMANNSQVYDEYKECRYAISFSTAAGIMSFGWLIGIFQNLILSEKRAFLKQYFGNLTPQTFNAWITSLNNLRNKCAHYQSLYRLSSMKELRPIMTKPEDQQESDELFSHHSFFYYTLIAIRLSPSSYNVLDFIDYLEQLFNKASKENKSFDLELDYSFPPHWQDYLKNEKGIRTMNT